MPDRVLARSLIPCPRISTSAISSSLSASLDIPPVAKLKMLREEINHCTPSRRFGRRIRTSVSESHCAVGVGASTPAYSAEATGKPQASSHSTNSVSPAGSGTIRFRWDSGSSTSRRGRSKPFNWSCRACRCAVVRSASRSSVRASVPWSSCTRRSATPAASSSTTVSKWPREPRARVATSSPVSVLIRRAVMTSSSSSWSTLPVTITRAPVIFPSCSAVAWSIRPSELMRRSCKASAIRSRSTTRTSSRCARALINPSAKARRTVSASRTLAAELKDAIATGIFSGAATAVGAGSAATGAAMGSATGDSTTGADKAGAAGSDAAAGRAAGSETFASATAGLPGRAARNAPTTAAPTTSRIPANTTAGRRARLDSEPDENLSGESIFDSTDARSFQVGSGPFSANKARICVSRSSSTARDSAASEPEDFIRRAIFPR